jgi:lysozyme
MTITEREAEDILTRDLFKYEQGVTTALTRRPTQPQFDAMVSLCYNIGPGAFRKSSALRLFNQGDKTKAANALLLWNKAGGKVLKGLTRRREAERRAAARARGQLGAARREDRVLAFRAEEGLDHRVSPGCRAAPRSWPGRGRS